MSTASTDAVAARLGGRPVHVFLPYADGPEGPASEWYGAGAFHDELRGWFAPGLAVEIVAVTLHATRQAVAAAREAGAVVLNLCDGDEADGYPGPGVVAALAAADVPYTGADPAFYRLSSSKLAMKAAFRAAGVRTAPWAAPRDADDLAAVGEAVGFPAILKLDVSADGLGLARGSVVSDGAELRREWERLAREGHLGRGPYVERFLSGVEYTVLVLADARAPGGLVALPAVAYAFDARVPPRERILFRGYRDLGVDGAPHVAGEPRRCEHRVAEAAMSDRCRALAIAAFRALGGAGYARVDMRHDPATDEIAVLEVNANCSLARGERSIAPALARAGMAFERLIATILADAVERRATSLV